jgi:hypothetical protein
MEIIAVHQEIKSFSEDNSERALLFSLKTFMANGKIPFTTIMQNGSAASVDFIIKLFGSKMVDIMRKAAELDIIKWVDHVAVWSLPYNGGEAFINLNIDGFEVYRKANKKSKREMYPFTCVVLRALGVEDVSLSSFYMAPESESKGTDLKSLVNGLSYSAPEKALIVSYTLKFASRQQFDRGFMPTSKIASDSLAELLDVVESGVFYFDGKAYKIDRDIVFLSLRKMSETKVTSLRNNNYLKRIFMSNISTPVDAFSGVDVVGLSPEGY